METRHQRKSRLTPVKRTRASLDFGQREATPSPMKKQKVSAIKKVQALLDEDESFNTRSFYGKREKKNFPHSPKRRKAAEKILAKISDKQTESQCSSGKSQTTKFEFHSTDSGDTTDNDGPVRPVLRQRNQRTVPKAEITPKAKAHRVGPTKSMSDNKIVRPDENTTPASSGKRFFKYRSPASADRCLISGKGSIVVGKGFNLKFIPRRLGASPGIQPSSAKKKSKPVLKQRKTKPLLPVFDGIDDIVFCTSMNPSETQEAAPEATANTEIDTSFDRDSLISDQSGPVSENIGAGSDSLFSEPLSRECESPDISSALGIDISPSQSSVAAESVSSGPVSKPKRLQNDKMLFPIFTGSQSNSAPSTPLGNTSLGKLRSSRSSPRTSPFLRHTRNKDKMEQLVIDAGQKRYGATQCDVCGMVYTIADPVDETTHQQFHRSLLNALKFSGWKKERVVQEYMDLGSRIVMVTADSPSYATKKVEEINKVMGQELGFPEPSLAFRENYKAFLYISSEKRIEGCCVAEPVTEGNRVLPESQSQSSQHQPGHRPWCCRTEPEKAKVGISRIWVYGQQRQKGIATRLLDSVRHWFLYGCVIKKKYVAFSDPTPDGKVLASKYTGTPEFLVYKFS